MPKKVAEVIADFLVEKGVTDMFTITGGGAMHLNDAFGHKEGLNCIYNHNEQASSMAAEGYARYSGKIAAVCVTSGPGGTNAITGVVGGFQDSIPMFVVSGTVKRETTVRAAGLPLRQLGDQEFNISECARGFTKYTAMVWEPEEILYHLEKAWYLANSGRKGPVWLDIPLDVQASPVEPEKLTKHFDPEKEMADTLEPIACGVMPQRARDLTIAQAEHPVYDEKYTKEIIDTLRKARRPVLFGGTAVNFAGVVEPFRRLVELLKIPTLTAWSAHDILPSESPYECGRPGTVGNRSGNFVMQNCDAVLILGSRLNIRLSSYNYRDFAKDACRIIVDIDEKELNKPTVKPTIGINADITDVINSLIAYLEAEEKAGNREPIGDNSRWLSWCRDINKKYPACLPEYYEKDRPLNPYAFTDRLFREHLKENDAIATGNGGACVITFQACYIKDSQRLFTNSGCAAMGYGFPAAMGVAASRETAAKNRGESKMPRTICIDGDGSFQMNIQELQAVVYNNMNMKIIIMNNNGYHSIRQTQKNLFKGRDFVGICDGNGVSFPDLSKLIPAYGIPYFRVDSLEGMDDILEEFLNTEGPALLEAIVDENQNFEPKLSSKVLPDGRIVSPPQDDMFPFVGDEEYKRIVDEARSI